MFSLILLAAGSGNRMSLGYNKMLYELDGTSIIERSIKAFYNNKYINQIIVVTSLNDLDAIKTLLNNYNNITYVIGDKERYLSVNNGLKKVTNDYVLIHDGARCFIKDIQINDIIQSTLINDATLLAVESKDTIHLSDDNLNIISTTTRTKTFIAQTPQGFKTSLIVKAYDELLKTNDTLITDDAMIVNKYTNHQVKIIKSDYSNIKITTKDDL